MDPRDSTSAPYVTPGAGDAWAKDAAAQGKVGTQKILAVENSPPSAEAREALDLNDGENVVTRRRLILADGQPVELADSHYPASIAAGTALAEKKRIKGGAVQALAEAGYSFDELDESITARPPTPEEQEHLAVGAGEWLIVMRRISRTAEGRPVEYAINRLVASRTAPLQYRMKVNRA